MGEIIFHANRINLTLKDQFCFVNLCLCLCFVNLCLGGVASCLCFCPLSCTRIDLCHRPVVFNEKVRNEILLYRHVCCSVLWVSFNRITYAPPLLCQITILLTLRRNRKDVSSGRFDLVQMFFDLGEIRPARHTKAASSCISLIPEP
jgi:hypothetical protein